MKTLIAGRVAAVLLAMVVVLTAGACAREWQRADGEPPPQRVTAVETDRELMVTCGGGFSFPLEALEGPSVEDEPGPEFDALRREAAQYTGRIPEFPAASNWRLLARSHEGVHFAADSTRGLIYLNFRWQGGAWTWTGGGDCNLHTVIGEGVGSARWWLDPRHPAPTAESTFLLILVEERNCASGTYATGRVAPPLAHYGADSITITIGVVPRPGFSRCPGNPPTPAIVTLSEPIGDRQLLDGFHVPPAPPEPSG